MRRAGLRTRVIAGFAAGALALSASMAFVSYELTRGALLAGRERATVRAAVFDARVVSAEPRHRPARHRGRAPVAGHRRQPADAAAPRRRTGTRATPTPARPTRCRPGCSGSSSRAARARSGCGSTASRRWSSASRCPPTTALYEIDYLRELDQTLRTLGWVLASSRPRSRRPARAWAGTRPGTCCGRCARSPTPRRASPTATSSARLDPAAEPDLARLTASFNGMVDQLARRHRAGPPLRRRRQPRAALPAADPGRVGERAGPAAGRTWTSGPRSRPGSSWRRSSGSSRSSTTCSSWPAATSRPSAHRSTRTSWPGAWWRARASTPALVEPAGDDGSRWLVDRRRLEQILAQPARQRGPARRRAGRGPAGLRGRRPAGSRSTTRGPGSARPTGR